MFSHLTNFYETNCQSILDHILFYQSYFWCTFSDPYFFIKFHHILLLAFHKVSLCLTLDFAKKVIITINRFFLLSLSLSLTFNPNIVFMSVRNNGLFVFPNYGPLKTCIRTSFSALTFLSQTISTS